MSFCSNCGTKITEADKFCPECGHPNETLHPSEGAPASAAPVAGEVHVAPPHLPPAAPVGSPAKKKLSGCAIAGIVGGSVLALFILLAVVIFVVVSSASSGAVEATRNHLTFLKSGDIESAYGGTSSGFQSATSLDQYRKFLSNYPALSDVASSRFNERSVENGVASLSGTITDSRGTEKPFSVRLVEENGAWKILGIDLTGKSTEAGSSVGTIVIGSGRKADGSLVNPGRPIPVTASDLSADIELINHPLGEKVEIWIEQGTNRTETFEATVEGAGHGNITFDIQLGKGNFAPGDYLLVVMLGEKKRFTKEFAFR